MANLKDQNVTIQTKSKNPKQLYEELSENVTHQVYNLVEHLRQWIEKNSQPKRYNFPKPVRLKPTRWAKRGPMARRDWVKFYNWAAKNAAPKPPYEPKLRKRDIVDAKKAKESKEPLPYEELMQHAQNMAIPRIRRNKYEYPPEPQYAYIPQIDPKRRPKRERGRPFRTPEVPPDFQHIELEIDFWSQLRFPIRPSTASYNPSKTILKLAEPKVVPPLKQHCPIPEKPVEYIAPRRRMSPLQWREHKRRLEYLAKPIYRPIIDYFYYG
ncbi:uncharacterized protein LOC106085475 [Stomoxys calcitrans]|uniref:uncharacterized protein LOC106085475 n=1 Tax=Stomoxys calcitrans TaxID=35570 RepID=UPI0027E38C1F|nr:uncharacterized protein LOC106085475 [Stomoxys calcitrans]